MVDVFISWFLRLYLWIASAATPNSRIEELDSDFLEDWDVHGDWDNLECPTTQPTSPGALDSDLQRFKRNTLTERAIE